MFRKLVSALLMSLLVAASVSADLEGWSFTVPLPDEVFTVEEPIVVEGDGLNIPETLIVQVFDNTLPTPIDTLEVTKKEVAGLPLLITWVADNLDPTGYDDGPYTLKLRTVEAMPITLASVNIEIDFDVF